MAAEEAAEDGARAPAGPGAGAAGGQDYEVRYDFEQDRAAGVGGEESHQESRQRLQACGEGLRR